MTSSVTSSGAAGLGRQPRPDDLLAFTPVTFVDFIPASLTFGLFGRGADATVPGGDGGPAGIIAGSGGNGFPGLLGQDGGNGGDAGIFIGNGGNGGRGGNGGTLEDGTLVKAGNGGNGGNASFFWGNGGNGGNGGTGVRALTA